MFCRFLCFQNRVKQAFDLYANAQEFDVVQKINQIVFTETAKALEMVDATELKLDLENRRPNDPIGNLEESNPSENGSSMVHFVRPMAKTDVEGVLNVLRQVPEQDSVILPLQTTIGRLVAEWETFKALCH